MTEIQRSRVCLIRWMADVLSDMPSEQLLGIVDEILAETDGFWGESAYALRNAAKRCAEGGAGALRALRVEHTDLFCGLRMDAPHPYESAYSSERRLLRQKAESQVREAYEQACFPYGETSSEETDFLPYELRFYVWLLERGSVVQAEQFLAEHVHNWVFRWCDDVRKQAQSDFYQSFAACLSEQVAADRYIQA